MSKYDQKSISEAQFEALIGNGNWIVNDTPRDMWSSLIPFSVGADTIKIVASGTLNLDDSRTMHELNNIVGGFDWLRKGKAYHFVIEKKEHQTYVYYGSFSNGLPIPHHYSEQDYSTYIDYIGGDS